MKEAGGNDAARREDAAERQFQRFIWTRWLLPLIGLWLLVAPPTFGYAASAMACSDYLAGALLVVLGLLSLSRRRLWAPWCVFLVGVWLELAPILLWAPASAYVNSSVAGIVVIALSVLIPDVPGGIEFRRPGPEVPPGWSYNPSAWVKRMPLVLMSLGGWFASRYLAAFHLGYILYLMAALTLTVSIVALGEVVRILRYLNVPIGLWIALSVWLLPSAIGFDKAGVALTEP